jgi:GAF domain-containing protein
LAKEDSKLNFVPILEEPSEGETATHGGLFVEDSFAINSSKLNVAEGLINILTRNYNFQEFIREILLTVMRAVTSEAGSFLEVDQTHAHLFFRCAVGTASDLITDFTIPIGQGVAGHVAESRRPYAVNNTAQNKIHLKSIGKAVGFEARNLVAVPIIIRGKVFGVLELLNRVGEKDYTDQDLEFLEYASQQIAKVIEVRLMISWAMKNQAVAEAGDEGSEVA